MRFLYFKTDKCTYCTLIGPGIQFYAEKKNIPLRRINAKRETNSDDEQALVEKYNIMSVPALVVEPDEGTPAVLRGYQDIMRYMNMNI